MLAYLFSRYPVVSQTFCDSEMLALEAMGVPLAVGSINPPPDAFRHPSLARRKAPVFYPPPSKALAAIRREAEADGSWAPLAELVAEHDANYGEEFKAATRARNALYFSRVFGEIGVTHVHVHFANRATHTALFLKRLGLPFSFTAHAQDFMVDLGSDDLLREMAREASFVAAVSDFSASLLRDRCPDSAGKIVRVYNGLDPEGFPKAVPGAPADRLKIVSIGRLIEFKGFHHLLDACRLLTGEGIEYELTIVGEGGWRAALEEGAREAGIASRVKFAGVLGGDAIKALLAGSHAFALGSIVDSKGASDILPTVIAEAMAAGLPVVSTRLVGIPEMVQDGRTGLLCEPGDARGMADALARLAREPETRQRFGAAGLALVRERFALDVTAKQLLDLFPARAADTPSYPQVAYLAPGWGARDPRSADPELDAAARHPQVLPIAFRLHDDFRSTSPAPPAGLHFMPDPLVVDAAWAAAPDRASRALALAGEEVAARYAVYLAEFLERLGIRKVHAARAELAEIAWLVGELLGGEASCCIEEGAAAPAVDIPVLSGLDLTVRKTRLKFGPIRIRLKPKPISADSAEHFIARLAG